MLACAMMWSISGIFIKMIPWNPLVIAGWRSLLGAAVIYAYMRVKRIPFIISRRSLPGGVFLALTFLTFLTANKMTSPANAVVLQYTAPIFILLFSALFLKKKFAAEDYAVVPLTVAGITMFFIDGLGAGNAAGNIIGVLSGVFFAAMFMTTNGTDENTRMNSILIGQMLTALVGIPLTAVFDTPVSAPALTSLFVLGIVQLGIPYILYGLAVKYCPPLYSSLLASLEPLVNPLLVYIFLGEAPGPWALFGGSLVIVTIACWYILKEWKISRGGAVKA
jgi:drug/metabolite transporter (DMT)-like permease